MSPEIKNKIKQLLEYQRYAVRRATSIGMSKQESTEMEARINEIHELLDQFGAEQS
jgi:hypothetical protein